MRVLLLLLLLLLERCLQSKKGRVVESVLSACTAHSERERDSKVYVRVRS